MALYEIDSGTLVPVSETTFRAEGLLERSDLQPLLRDRFDVIDPDVLIVAEEFGNWEDSARRIDLLGVDRSGTIVVVELKRTKDGGHMELQALRYAAMVSNLDARDLIEAYAGYLERRGDTETDAEAELCAFFEADSPDDIEISDRPRIVLASQGFGTELTTAVLWLNEGGLDIRCVEVSLHRLRDAILLSVQQVIPLPEAADFWVKKREKTEKSRSARRSGRDLTKYDFEASGDVQSHLPKRQLIRRVVRHLVDGGISVDEIRNTLGWRSNAFRVVDGIHDQASFVRTSDAERERLNKKPDTYRYQTSDSDLYHANGATYALSRMWGRQTERAVRELQKAFPQAPFNFRPSVGSRDDADEDDS